MRDAATEERALPVTMAAGCCADAGPAVSEICVAAHRRLLDLEPYIQEAERLRRILAAAQPPATPPAPSMGRRRLAAGENKQLIVRELAAHPGSTAAQIAERTGRKRTVVASTMSRMARHGELQRCASGYQLPALGKGHGTAS